MIESESAQITAEIRLIIFGCSKAAENNMVFQLEQIIAYFS